MRNINTTRKHIPTVAALCLAMHIAPAWSKQITFPCAGSTIVLMDSASAANINVQADAYTRELTPFDLAIRFDKTPDKLSQRDYLHKAAVDARNWPADEQAQLRLAFGRIDSFAKASGVRLHMPDTVKMIKTSGGEEFGAEGYTRGNRIMLNTAAQPIGLHLVAHELWHVISRGDEKVRNDAYAVFHFKPCNNIVYKPAMHNHVITNPDCPYLQHYVHIDKDGAGSDVAPVLYTKEDYHPGFVAMQSASIGLLALTGDDAHKQPLMKDGEPVIYEIETSPDFMKQIGMNTQYLLHIEEIAAEHFAALVGGMKLRQMEYVEGMKAALMQ